MTDLDDLLKTVWPSVRRRHLFPELPAPACADGELRAGLDIKGKKISISRKFVEEMSVALKPQEILEGLLDHAVSHYIYCPWNLANHLKLYAEAKAVLEDKEMALRATDCFMDVVADTLCVSQKETSLPKIYRHLDRTVLDEAVHALFQRIWGVDLGVQAYEELSSRLSRIPYQDRGSWMKGIRQFSKLIQPLLEMEKDYGNLNTPCPMGGHGLQQYSTPEIEEGLKDLALDAVSPADFEETIRDFEDEISEAIQPASQGSDSASVGSMNTNILYYMKLAENYALPIRKVPTESSGATYPDHHISWEAGLPYQDIDLWTSFGKFMPGITQTWRRTGLYGDHRFFRQYERSEVRFVICSAGCGLCLRYLFKKRCPGGSLQLRRCIGRWPANPLIHTPSMGDIRHPLSLLCRGNKVSCGGHRCPSNGSSAGYIPDIGHADYKSGSIDPIF